jgi:lysophospholipase L1-like esterase
MKELPKFGYVTKKDTHSEPFECVVVLGESHVAAKIWVEVFADLLKRFQGPPEPKVINAGIGGNAISPRSPGYPGSSGPSAIERYREDVVAHEPDLVILSYGLNDMRAGMAPEDFREDLSKMVGDIQEATGAVVVLTTVYNMSAYALFPPYDVGCPEAAEVYNLVIKQVAKKYDALVADIWEAEGQAPWVMAVDTVHANEMGHTLIGHRVFETVAANCSGAAQRLKIPPDEAREQLKEKHEAALQRTKQRLAERHKG